MSSNQNDLRIKEALDFLDLHYDAFFRVAPIADKWEHPVPADTRGWSQILVSSLVGVKGLKHQKGADLADGSDVKAANTWKAIDTPRFNGVIKAGTQSKTAGKIESLDAIPHLYLVLWDENSVTTAARCRIWVVRPQHDRAFRQMCKEWYHKLETGEIESNNFQLHPPRGQESNIIRNTCGNLEYPLLFRAERALNSKYGLIHFDPRARSTGTCRRT